MRAARPRPRLPTAKIAHWSGAPPAKGCTTAKALPQIQAGERG
jgi:hypothetical protein